MFATDFQLTVAERQRKTLKIQLQSKLNFARRALEQGRIARAGDFRNPRESDLRVGIVELRRVEQVERFSAKLQAPPFPAQGEVLEQRRVHLLGPRTVQNVAARVAIGVIAWRSEE